MKRSTTVLLLLGAAGATAYALADSSDDADTTTDAAVYANAQDCTAAGVDAGDCARTFAAATTENEAKAPHYVDKADCERDYGAASCQTRASTGPGIASYFVPAMIGFAVARSLSSGGQPAPAQPLYGCPPQRASAGGCYSTASGSSFASSSGGSGGGRTASVPTSGFRPSTTGSTSPTVVSRGSSVSVASRGGFGSTGHSFSSSGS